MPCREGGAFYDYFFVDLNYLIYLLLSVGRFCEADICLILWEFSTGGTLCEADICLALWKSPGGGHGFCIFCGMAKGRICGVISEEKG